MLVSLLLVFDMILFRAMLTDTRGSGLGAYASTNTTGLLIRRHAYLNQIVNYGLKRPLGRHHRV